MWWPNEPGRRSSAEGEFFKLPPEVQGLLGESIKRLLDGQTRFKDVDNLGDGVRELRCRWKNNQYRILYFVAGRTCVGLTCVYKDQRRIGRPTLKRAKDRKKTYRGP